jgi:hypothetical protein
MRKLQVGSMPTQKKRIPMVMGIANTIIETLRFLEIINETVRWDRAHWNISPGGLAKILVLGTLTDTRIPPCRSYLMGIYGGIRVPTKIKKPAEKRNFRW